MNSKQRRKTHRKEQGEAPIKLQKWLNENREEIKRVIFWIRNAPDFVRDSLSPWDKDKPLCMQMKKNHLVAFGLPFGRTKDDWRKFLQEKGVRV